VPTVRISDTFEQPEMATDLFEHNMAKLNILRQRGSEPQNTIATISEFDTKRTSLPKQGRLWSWESYCRFVWKNCVVRAQAAAASSLS
jgi:hypothetical protein